MRYPREHKVQTRARILKAAGETFRRRGYGPAGIDGIMGDAGLTAGGFYAHFRSKEELLSEVLSDTLRLTRSGLLAGVAELPGEERIAEVVRRYLSRTHRDAAGAGCPLPALAADVSRQGKGARKVLARYLRELTAEMAELGDDAPGLEREERVLGTMALCVGALVLARAVDDPELSDRLLLAGRRYSAAAGRAPAPAKAPPPAKAPRDAAAARTTRAPRRRPRRNDP